MGKTETASVSIGIKINLGLLVEQINENNFNKIKKILECGFIDDDNGYFNETYRNIYYEYLHKCENIYLLKNKLIELFTIQGDLHKSRFSNEITNDLSSGNLYSQFLLLNCHELLITERCGYDREGINSSSINLDFNIESIKKQINDRYSKIITNYNIVMILKQNSG